MKNFAIYFVFLLFVGCKKEEKENSVIPNEVLSSFPLNIGNEWEYNTETTISSPSGTVWILNRHIEKWNALSDTLINGLLCTEISQLDSNVNGQTNHGSTFYSNQPDGLLGVAQENNGTTMSFKSEQEDLRYSCINYNINRRSGVDTVFIPVLPLLFMKFPIVLNEVWVSNEYISTPNAVKRKWIGNEFITTPAGTFYCTKLKMYWDANNDMIPDSSEQIVTQYFSSKGLIKEETFNIIAFGGSNDIDTLRKISELVRVNF